MLLAFFLRRSSAISSNRILAGSAVVFCSGGFSLKCALFLARYDAAPVHITLPGRTQVMQCDQQANFLQVFEVGVVDLHRTKQ